MDAPIPPSAYVTGMEAIGYLIWGEFHRIQIGSEAAWTDAAAKLFDAHLRGALTLLSKGRRLADELPSGAATRNPNDGLSASDPIPVPKDNLFQGDWDGVVVLRSEVIALAYGRPEPKSRKSNSAYAAKDARLYARMAQLIQSGEAASSYAAAKAVAHLAEGTNRGDHKIRRLQRGFDKARNNKPLS